MHVSTAEVVSFHQTLTEYYYEAGRHDLPWRSPEQDGSFDPYKVFISEVMLQQTQAGRVTPKYAEFLERFPAVHDLASAPLSSVLIAWSGLGYNRRAKYVWQAARMVEDEYAGVFPDSSKELQQLPGVGPNTAGAVLAYAYDEPAIFIETNIRTVIIHHFFKQKTAVTDKSILEVLGSIVPKIHDAEAMHMQGAILGPREFYWAMMDYGTFLKKTVGNLNRVSKHYAKQTSFKGSKREIRGHVIRLLSDKAVSWSDMRKAIPDERLDEVLRGLESEGLIVVKSSALRLADISPKRQ